MGYFVTGRLFCIVLEFWNYKITHPHCGKDTLDTKSSCTLLVAMFCPIKMPSLWGSTVPKFFTDLRWFLLLSKIGLLDFVLNSIKWYLDFIYIYLKALVECVDGASRHTGAGREIRSAFEVSSCAQSTNRRWLSLISDLCNRLSRTLHVKTLT